MMAKQCTSVSFSIYQIKVARPMKRQANIKESLLPSFYDIYWIKECVNTQLELQRRRNEVTFLHNVFELRRQLRLSCFPIIVKTAATTQIEMHTDYNSLSLSLYGLDKLNLYYHM